MSIIDMTTKLLLLINIIFTFFSEIPIFSDFNFQCLEQLIVLDFPNKNDFNTANNTNTIIIPIQTAVILLTTLTVQIMTIMCYYS